MAVMVPSFFAPVESSTIAAGEGVVVRKSSERVSTILIGTRIAMEIRRDQRVEDAILCASYLLTVIGTTVTLFFGKLSSRANSIADAKLALGVGIDRQRPAGRLGVMTTSCGSR